MKKIISVIICLFGLVSSSFSQSYNRMENPNYARTTFFEDFNSPSLNTSIWEPTIHTIKNGSPNYAPNLFIFVDSIATINPTNGSLNLSMLSYPNYPGTDWQGHRISANFIAGEVNTSQYFSHGVFECNATFANGHGSFPAFWLHGNPDCQNRDGNEIDFVELKINNSNSDFNYNTFRYPVPCQDGVGNGGATFPYVSGNHTFKGVWGPSKIEFWKDNTKVGTIVNTSQIWYPQYPMRIILSQQIWNYNNNSPGYGIVTPQTSVFHWVRYKEFFLSPEITLSSNIICSSGTASMNVDLAASNITWALTPSTLFNGATAGIGKIANITASPTSQGKGKITYSFNMSNDISNPKEIYTATKDIWIKGPDPSEMTFDVYKSNGVRAMQVGNTFLMCPNTTYQIYAMNSGPVPLSNYVWTVPSGWSRFYTNDNIISINTNSAPGGPVIFTATNTTSGCNNTIKPVTGYMGGMYNCGTYLMVFTPNPSTNETTLVLSADGEKIVNENSQWELEVFDQQQGLKEKRIKIKGKQTNINTSNWKDGIYLVRIKIGDEIISEKLVVKH